MVNRFQAKPLADKRLARHTYSMAVKASADKLVYRGVKEVQKAIRKGEKGLVIIGGDVTPLELIAHFPVFCENHGVPYYFVPSRVELGRASRCRGSSSIIMIKEPTEDSCAWAKEYRKIHSTTMAVMKKAIEGIIEDTVVVGSK